VGSDDVNGPKRRDMRHLGPRYVFVRILYILTNYSGSIYVLKARMEFEWAMTT
jgi:hypothetical protein